MTEPLSIPCRACGIARELSDYRVFSSKPLQYMDFCIACERREGTITLYRRFHAYATPQIVDAVFAAERAPAAKRTLDQARVLVPADSVPEPKDNADIVKRELARRELARRRLLYFTTTFQPDYKPGWVHQDVCRRLERFIAAVERGESPRLMLFMPPRVGKSEAVSKKFVSWALGRHPEWTVLGASYAQSLPIGFSREIRDTLGDPEYQAMFPDTKLRSDNKGVEEWKTTRGGGYIAAGVGVGITGKGMMIGILDDPLKDQEAAQSDVIRQAAVDWYQAVFRTRLAPGGGIIVVLTRWHDSDPAGALLAKEAELRKLGVPEHELEGWDVVSYPAIAEADEWLLADGEIWRGTPDESDAETARLLRRKGDALHPERYPISELRKLKNTLATSIWSALYQQNPTPDDGDFFKRSDLRYRVLSEDELSGARIFLAFDLAIKKSQKRDFTVGGVFALTRNDDLCLLDLVRGRWGTMEIVENVVALVEKWRPEVLAGERGQIYESVWPLVKAALAKKRLYLTHDESLVPINDKEVRARPLQGRTQLHKFIISTQNDRPAAYDELEKELLRFPNGTHDDIVDACAWAARMAMNMSVPRGDAATPPIPKSWKDKFKPSTNNSYMTA